MPAIKPNATQSCLGRPAICPDLVRHPRINANITPEMTMIPVRSNRKAVIGWFLSSITHTEDHSGFQRDPIRATIPQEKRKTKA